MKLRKVQLPNFLIKFFEKEEFRDSFLNGNIYLKESGYFRKLEDTYRGDVNDGLMPIDVSKTDMTMTVQKNGMVITADQIKNFKAGFVGDDKIPIFCGSILNNNIVYETEFHTLKFKKEFIDEITKFGKYIAFINLDEFMAKVQKVLLEKQIGFKCDQVTYVDILNEYTNKPLGHHDWEKQLNVFFRKDTLYRWQNEWRLLLEPTEKNVLIGDDSDHYILSIGPLDQAAPLNADVIINKEIYVMETDGICTISFE